MTCKPYELDLINALKNATENERIEYFEAMYEKNKVFFQTESEGVFKLLNEATQLQFDINMTNDFFNIIDRRTKEYIHPKDQLDVFSEHMGAWLNDTWIDLTHFKVSVSQEKETIHSRACLTVNHGLINKFPNLLTLFSRNVINLKNQEAYPNLKYSPGVVFIGVSHGLHIVKYLNQTVQNNVLLIEPDVQKFVLSCYFLDYAQIKENSSSYVLAIGEKGVDFALRSFMSQAHLSTWSWLRVQVTPYFDNEKAKVLLSKIRSSQLKMDEVFFGFDSLINAYLSAHYQLDKKLPLLSRAPKLSNKATIAIVASGPSLGSDIDFLKKNQDHLIIMSVLSATKMLLDNDIEPDFVLSLDSRVPRNFKLKDLGITSSTPIVALHGTAKEYTELTDHILLCGQLRSMNLIDYKEPLKFNGSSSANFVFGLALLSKAKNILLLGCDCSYVDNEKVYAEGSTHSIVNEKNKKPVTQQAEQDPTGHLRKQQYEVEQNLNRKLRANASGELITVLHGFESMITEFNQGSTIYNLSKTGAFIQGTVPMGSKDFVLSTTYDKTRDIQAIKDAFDNAEEGNNWRCFEGNAAELLQHLKANILSQLNNVPKDWAEMIKNLEESVGNSFSLVQSHMYDARLTGHRNLCESMLRMIMNYVLRVDFFEEALAIYKEGVALFEKALEMLEWPVELEKY